MSPHLARPAPSAHRVTSLVAIVALLGGLVGAGCKGPAGKPAPTTEDGTVAAWRSDLALVAAELAAHHPAPFGKTSEPTFRAAVAALDRAIPDLTAAERLVGLARVIALVGDGHTNLMPGKLAFVMVTPMQFYWFADGIHVIAAAAPYHDAVGARVVSVGGHPIDDVATTLDSTFGWDSEGGRRQQVAFLLTFAVALRGADLAPADGPIRYGLVDRSGAARELAIEPRPWRGPDPEPSPPLARRNPRQAYWSEYLPDAHALYVQYRRCEDDPARPFADFTAGLVATLDREPVERLIIDLRDNGGGNSEVIRPLLAVVTGRPALRGRVFALIGRATFSSAIYNTVWLDQAGAMLVGEPAGSAASHFGEVRRVPLPGTGNTLVHATKWHELPGYPPTALPPEVLVEQTAAQYFAGEDPALAAALAQPVPFSGR